MKEQTESGVLEASDHCLTRHINDTFSRCLSDAARSRCNYALLFGDDYLCIHPRHREFG